MAKQAWIFFLLLSTSQNTRFPFFEAPSTPGNWPQVSSLPMFPHLLPMPGSHGAPNLIHPQTTSRFLPLPSTAVLRFTKYFYLSWLILFTSICFQRKLHVIAVDGRSVILSVKSGFDVLVTLILIIIIKCIVIKKTLCPSVYNSCSKKLCHQLLVSWEEPCVVSLPQMQRCVSVEDVCTHVCVFISGSCPSDHGNRKGMCFWFLPCAPGSWAGVQEWGYGLQVKQAGSAAITSQSSSLTPCPPSLHDNPHKISRVPWKEP